MAKPFSLLAIASVLGLLVCGAGAAAQGTGSGGCYFGECDETQPRSQPRPRVPERFERELPPDDPVYQNPSGWPGPQDPYIPPGWPTQPAWTPPPAATVCVIGPGAACPLNLGPAAVGESCFCMNAWGQSFWGIAQ
jgi:hypothetical protein